MPLTSRFLVILSVIAAVFLPSGTCGFAALLADTPAWTVNGTSGSRLGWRVTSAGDVNRDGYDDVLVLSKDLVGIGTKQKEKR